MNRNLYAPPEATVEGPLAVPPSVLDAGAGRWVSFNDLAERDKWRFVWGFIWRSICASLLSFVAALFAGVVLGIVIAIIARVTGTSSTDFIWTTRILGGLCGLGVGLVTLRQLIKWYFRANWFGHRLVLLRVDA
jgi:hypothetical protein